MMRLLTTATIATAMSVATQYGALAACEPFVAYGPGDEREAYHVDLGEEGPNVGDKSIGWRKLHDADGNPVGEFLWVAHVEALDANGVPTSLDANTVFVLDDGVIFSIGEISLQSALATHSEKSGFAPSAVVSWDIIGGTGAYAGVRGTLTAEADGDDNVYRVDLICD